MKYKNIKKNSRPEVYQDNLFNIILDGLDELPNTPKVRKLIKKIESLYPDFEASDDD